MAVAAIREVFAASMSVCFFSVNAATKFIFVCASSSLAVFALDCAVFSAFKAAYAAAAVRVALDEASFYALETAAFAETKALNASKTVLSISD